jgi:hypothetical protein
MVIDNDMNMDMNIDNDMDMDMYMDRKSGHEKMT